VRIVNSDPKALLAIRAEIDFQVLRQIVNYLQIHEYWFS
jgi:hypothetical protein